MISPFGPTCPAAAVPIAPKMPAPITAPIASMIKSPAPSTRLSDCVDPSPASNSAIGLRANRSAIYPLSPASLSEAVDTVARRDDEPALGAGREADQPRAADDTRAAVIVQTIDATRSRERLDDVKIARRVEGKS